MTVNYHEQYLEKPLPANPDAERIILGAVLIDNGLIAQAAELSPDDFYSPAHRKVFRAMAALFARSAEITPVAIAEQMKLQGTLIESVGGPAAIGGYTYGLPFFSSIADYVNTVREKATARRFIRSCSDAISRTLDESAPVESVMDRHEQKIYDLRQADKKEPVSFLGDIITKSCTDAAERSKNGVKTLGLETGFTDFDQLTAGLQKTDLILVAARPSMGKSSLALDLVLGATEKQPEAVCAVFSLEMSKDQCAGRMICSQSKVEYNDYRLGQLTRAQWETVAETAARLHERRIFVDDTAAISTMELKAKARQVAAKNKRLDLIVVDYLQLMRGTGESRQQEVSQISRDLKAIAKDLQVPVVALSQLSRACEARTDKRPLLSDLRESGSLEQDSDVVIFIYRDEYYNPMEENTGVAELIFRKHRHGETKTIKLGFMSRYTKFVNFYG